MTVSCQTRKSASHQSPVKEGALVTDVSAQQSCTAGRSSVLLGERLRACGGSTSVLMLTTDIDQCQRVARIPASTPDHALPGSGAASVTISSWPTVSLPNSSGTQAPIAPPTAIVPKNILG